MSKSTEPPRIITSPDAAAFLIRRAGRRYMWPFLGCESTVAQAARELNIAPNSMLYRVRRMLELNLLEVVREEARAGRAVRVYRAVADRIFIPYAASPAVDLLEVLRENRGAFEDALQRAIARVMRDVHGDHGWGLLMYREGDGTYEYDAIAPGAEAWNPLGPDEPAVLDHSMVLPPMTHVQAKALQRELLDVLARHVDDAEDEPGRGKRHYLVRLGLAPQPMENTATGSGTRG